MDFTRLKYIKNVNDDESWAYKDNPLRSYFRLNFKRSDSVDVETHAKSLHKGSLIILSQKPHMSKRYLTHVVELVNEGSEDEPQHEAGIWGIFRWVKVHWIADFSKIDHVPVDLDVMKVNWGYEGTLAKSLEGKNLMSEWTTIDNLRTHLKGVFIF